MKNKMKTRVFPAFLAAIIMMAGLLTASCFEKESGGHSSFEGSGAESASGEKAASSAASGSEEDDPFGDNLPVKDFGGRSFTVLQRTEYKYEYENDENVSDKVNDLISERNHLVEERFGVKIQTLCQDGVWGVHESFMNYVRNTISGGTAEYDIISGYAAIMPSLISDNLFINWHEAGEYINFDKPRWSRDFISEMTVNGKLYLLSGDISLTFWESMQCIFFNKTLASVYNLDNLYDMVRKGEWTFDAMFQIIKNTADGNTDPESRVYGYATALTTQIDVYQDAFHIPVTTKGSDGRPFYTINDDRTGDALDMLYDLVVDSPYTKICIEDSDFESTLATFGEGRALFAPMYFGAGAALQNYDTIYGILPMPKFNKEQDDYHSACLDFYSVLAIPLTSDDQLDFISIITEALCVESSRFVVPQYYALVLKERYTNDEDSIEMIDIVRDGVLCNFGYLYSYTLNWPAHQLNVCINNKTRNFVSNWESKVGGFETNLEKALAYYFDE